MYNLKKLHEIFEEVHQLYVHSSKLAWALFTTGYDFGVEEAELKIVEALKNKEHFQYISDCKELDLNNEDKRRVEILFHMFKPYHLSDELNDLNIKIQKKVNDLTKILNTFRYTFEGKKVTFVELNQILTSDENRERRKAAYFTMNQINEPMVNGGFIELIKLRKEFAKKAGEDNFVTYKLKENELSTSIFDNWLKELQDILPTMKKVRKEYANEYLNDDVIMPWDEQYITAKIAPSLKQTIDMSNYYDNIKDLFNLFGIDISKFNITYDIFPRTNKSEWGYNFPIETAKDSRILANVKNKFYEYNVLLHETGHAVHSFLLDPNKPILNSGVSGIINEGLANLFQSFLSDKAFFGKFFTDIDSVQTEFDKLSDYKKINSLRAIANIFFDHRLYKEDIETINDIYNLYWTNLKEVLDEEPYEGNPPWAYRIHHTTHPIYLHNYFMGDVTCEMLKQVFKTKYNSDIMDKPQEFGQFIIDEVISPTGLYKYNELFKNISGNDFSLKYMID